MSAVYASLLACVATFPGMAALAFAMDRHHAQLTGVDVPLRRRQCLRVTGGVLLVLALLPCLGAWGSTVGVVAWLGFVSLGALGTVATISAVLK